MPYIGQGLQQGRRQLHTFTATASQTTFSVPYSPGFVDVYQNGILLAPSDYTATNGTTVVLAVGAAVNDEITIIAQHLFSVADVVSASQGGTFAGDVTMTGNLTVQGTTITVDTSTAQTLAMGDADKIILGDDNDLQIFHDGNDSFISDQGSGSLYLLGTGNILLKNASNNETYLQATSNDAVSIYYDNSKKLETTNTGVTVTGTVVSDGITSNDDIVINSIGSGIGGCLQINNSSTSNNFPKAIEAYNSGISAGQRHQIMLGKDGSAYDTASLSYYYAGDASTSNRLEFGFWGAGGLLSVQADGNVGIGTNNPSQKLHVSSSDHTKVLVTAGTDKYAELQFENDAQKFAMGVQNDDKFFLYNNTGTTQVLTVDTSSNIGINTQSPGSRKLKIVGSTSAYPLAIDSTDTDYALEFQRNGTSEWWLKASSTSFQIHENGSGDHVTVLSGGYVGIGDSSPTKPLTLGTTTPVMLFDDQNSRTMEIRGPSGTQFASVLTTSNNALLLGTNSTERMRIAADGDIGIGTTPYANARLTIGGTEGGGYPAVLQFDNNNTSGAEFFMLATDTNWSAGSNKFIMGHGAPMSSNADVTIDSTGYVGINTTSPQRALHIHDHSATGLHITNTQSGAGANDGFSMYIRDDNQATELMGRENAYLGFGTNGTIRARIESGGEFFWPEIGNRGDITFPICSISNAGSGNRYLHAQFQANGGDMLHIHFRGYEYIGSSMREGSGGGYVYNTGGQNAIYAEAKSGHCVSVYQTTTNRVELVIDTGVGQTSNRWGSYVFFGGTDTITSNSPLTLVQYAWNAYTARLYSS